MTTIHAAIALAGRLAAQAQEQGVTVGSVVVSAASLCIYAADAAEARALAVALGLTDRHELDHDGRLLEFFSATHDEVCVQTHGPVMAAEATGARTAVA